ncbi:hypothetical protein [Elizabethkingia meningoseptica]|uniref:hypothetical protein n=1 Tax=Elizabethkingia meningoseptica TaxID=238 RepID=UPI0038929B84
MMKKAFSFLTLALLSVSCISDNRDIDDNDLRSKFYSVYTSKAEKHLLIENIKGAYDNDNSIVGTSLWFLKDIPRGLTLNGKTIAGTTENGNVWRSSDPDMKSLFGSTVSLRSDQGSLIVSSIDRNENKPSQEEVQLYIPKDIKVEILGIKNRNLVPGSVITWNKDINNLNKVMIVAEYSPYGQTDPSIVKRMPDLKTIYTEVEDNGSYTFTAKDLKYFPSGSHLTFSIARSAFAISSDGTKTARLSIGAITKVVVGHRIVY